VTRSADAGPTDRRPDPFDELDEARHDTTLAILDAANEVGQFTDFEQEEAEFGLWGHAGLDTAQHPLTALLRESHNETCVVRDLDGSLQLLWQESAISDRWARGPLHRESLIDDATIEERAEDDPRWLSGANLALPLPDLLGLLKRIPSAPGRVVDY
jgi:hypothetical protein